MWTVVAGLAARAIPAGGAMGQPGAIPGNPAPAEPAGGKEADGWSGGRVSSGSTGESGRSRCHGSRAPVCRHGRCDPGSWLHGSNFGKRGSGLNRLLEPEGVSLSADGLTAMIADTGNHRIAVWTRPGATSGAWRYSTGFGAYGSGPDGLAFPTGIFLSPDALSAWVADNVNSRVSVWVRESESSVDWTCSGTFGSAGSDPQNLRYPADVAAAPDGLTAWVADTLNSRIVVWTRPRADSTTWSFTTRFGSHGAGNAEFRLPESVSISPDTLTAWVADTRNHRVSIWSRPDQRSDDWRPVSRFGMRGSGPGDFDEPRSIAVAPDTLTAWIADEGNDRVSIWTRPDRASHAWSPAAAFGSTRPGACYLDAPNGIAVSADSLTVIVADLSKSRISAWART